MEKMVATLQQRAQTLVELVDQARFYFCDDISIDPQASAKILAKANAAALRTLRDELAGAAEWTAAGIQAVFEVVMQRYEINRRRRPCHTPRISPRRRTLLPLSLRVAVPAPSHSVASVRCQSAL